MADAIERCLKKDPTGRFRSAAEMTAALSVRPRQPPQTINCRTATNTFNSTCPLPSAERPAARPRSRRRRAIGAMAARAVVGILTTILALDTSGGSARSTPPASGVRAPLPRPPDEPVAGTNHGYLSRRQHFAGQRSTRQHRPRQHRPRQHRPRQHCPGCHGPASTPPTKGPSSHGRATGHRHLQH